MIRLKVFISSVQKELRSERIAVASLLSTDDFLRECTVPRMFEDYPQPLRPNPKAYLGLLRQCQIYLLLIGREYGADAGYGLSATHEEYRLAQELKLPTLVCVKGKDEDRVEKEKEFFQEIRDAKHIYSRLQSEEKLLEAVGKRLREHIETTFAVEPRRAQLEQSKLNRRSASSFERMPLESLIYEDLDSDLALDMMASAEDRDKDKVDPGDLPRLLLSRSFLWKDRDVLRPTVAGALMLARKPGNALPQARVQMDAFPGTSRNADAFDSDILDAPLPHMVEIAVAFVRRNTAKPLVVQGLSWLELMDDRGSGIPRMTRLLEQVGHPRPAFRIDHDCLEVELRPPETSKEERFEDRKEASGTREKHEMQPREAILAEVRASGRISTKICVQRLGISSASAKRIFKELVKKGILTMEGSGRSTHYRLSEPI